MLAVDMKIELPFEIHGNALEAVPSLHGLPDLLIGVDIEIIHTERIA